MIYEQRTYTIRPGKLPEYLKRWEEECLPIIGKYGKLMGCWQTESGKLNSVVFLWGYNDFAHRTEQRKKLKNDAEWKKASAWVGDFLVLQESTFLLPTAFSPDN